jgi:hypothetical protein
MAIGLGVEKEGEHGHGWSYGMRHRKCTLVETPLIPLLTEYCVETILEMCNQELERLGVCQESHASMLSQIPM